MSAEQTFLARDANAYLASILPAPHPAMSRLEKEVGAEGQPAVGRQTGGLLRALALASGAKRILEVGTNAGYSGLWLCDGLARGGRFEGIEIDADLARRARANLREATEGRGVDVVVHEGAALDVLPSLPERAYDLVFLDAVKAEYPRYLDHALRLLRPGGILAADNMFWLGQAWQAGAEDEETLGVREFTRRIFEHPRLSSTIVPVEDGLAVAFVRRD